MPEGKICFEPAWIAAVARGFGYDNRCLIAREGRTVRGLLPLLEVRSRLFGHRLITQAPFYSYGGPLADDSEVRDALVHHAIGLAEEQRCDYIEFRTTETLPYNLVVRTGKMCMHLSLAADPEVLWKSLDPKVRNQVRKAEKSGLVALSGGLELLDEFYRLYTIRIHQLGIPCFSKRIMYGILKDLPEYSRIFAVKLGDRTIGAGFTTCFNRFAEIHWGATLVEYNALCPNNLLYWSIIRYYCLAGAAVFDFGRCSDGGNTYHFKKQWGTVPVPLYYQYWVRPGHALAVASADDPAYRRKIALWKKMPLWLTRFIGPRISPHLP
jgi:FemAB-related protein (PEP-CTERM system-associated)